MKRKILITLNAVFFVLAVLLLITRAIQPFINFTLRFGISDAWRFFAIDFALYSTGPILFGWMIFNVLKRRWSLVLYVGSFVLLILAAIVLATGFVLLFQGEQSGAMAIATIAAAFLLLVTAWLNGRTLKVFKSA